MIHTGYGKRTITPPLVPPVFLSGFGQNRIAAGVHDDLTARVLALETGGRRVFLAALDLLGFGRHHCLEVESRLQVEFPGAVLIVCCTHTHHGPDPIGFWGPEETVSGVNADYIDRVKGEIFSACKEAAGRMSATTSTRAVSIPVEGVARNYRDPLILDIELTCLQFIGADGQVLANVLVYPCHPEVLSPENTEITSDYPDVLRKEVEAVTGAPALFFAGALGGMMSPATEDRTFAGAAEAGLRLARAALGALSAKDPEPFREFAHIRGEFSVPLENPVFRMAVEIGLIPELRDGDGNLATEANLLRFGDAWFVSVPGELFPVLGLEIKTLAREAGAKVAGVIGLGNDELGYIMPEEVYVFPDNPFEPGDHYEETMSAGAQTAPLLMAAVRNMMGV